MIEPFPIRSPYACRTWPPGLADLSAPTATFPLHDVTDVFAEQPTLRDRSVLTASRLRQTHVPDSGLDTSLGRLPFPRRQVPKEWWSQTGSNRRPHACKARALPAELCPRSRDECSTLKTNVLQMMSTSSSSFKDQSAQIWWAWEDLNFRPHAYQARALTN